MADSDLTPGAVYPRRRADLAISPIEVDGVEYFAVKDMVTGAFYRLRAPECWLLERLDGETPPGELAARFNLRFDTRLTDADITQFVGHLDQLNLTLRESSPAAGSGVQTGQTDSGAEILHQTRKFRLTEIYFGTIDPSKLIDSLTSWYRPFHNRVGLVLATSIVTVGLAVFISNFSVFSLSYELLTQGSSLGMLIAAMFVMITVHEFAHAIILRYYGGKVTRMGFMLLFFQPCFYCDVSDAWSLRHAGQRMAVSSAGLIAQLMMLALGAIFWRLLEPTTLAAQFARGLVVVSWVNFFFNFNPLIRFDGYYFLSDFWGIPNLREKSMARVRQSFRRALGLPQSAADASEKAPRRLFWFGLASLLFSFALIIASIWFFGGLVSRFFGFGGVLLYSLLVAGILSPTVWRTGKSCFAQTVQSMTEAKRSIRVPVIAVIALVVMALFLFFPIPHTTGGTISIRPLHTFDLRLTESGLLEREEQSGGAHPSRQNSFLQPASNDIAALSLIPKIADGATVRKGDTVAIFASNEVTRQLQEAEAELARLQSELALVKAPPKKERIAEAQSQIESAKADLSQKRSDLTRAESLSVRGLIPAAQLEAQRTAVSMAEATMSNRESTLRLIASPPRPEEESVIVNAIEKQKARLNFLKTQSDAQLILSPIDGKALVSREGNRVLSIRDIDSMEVSIRVNEADLQLVWLAQHASIKVRSHPDTLFTGEVVRVPVAAAQDSAHGIFTVGVVVANEGGMLREGMEGYGKITVGEITPAGLLWRKLMSSTRVEFWGIW